MLVQFGTCRLQLAHGDIAAQRADAIVNAANSALAGGGGVDGAIHRAAGPALMEETRRRYPQGCPIGGAVATSAGRLAARHVFHAVGPVWSGGRRDEEQLLSSCYRRCLELAVEHECDSITFPAISTGAYGYPIDLAAGAALSTARAFLVEHQRPALVRFILFSEGHLGAFARVLEAMAE